MSMAVALGWLDTGEVSMSEHTRQEMEVVERLEDIPAFAAEDEEHRYWAIHTLSEALLNQMGPVEDGFLAPPRPRTRPVPIPFSDDIIQRAKVLAARRQIGYQTLLKEFVVERLNEEEKQAGPR